MTPTPPSSNSQSPKDQKAPSHAYRVVRKRNRVPLSCGPCRNRKLKCNRRTPCENCVRRNDASSCTYATTTMTMMTTAAAKSTRYRKQSAGSSSSSSDEMQSRIDRLEGLVLSLMAGGSNNVSGNRDALSSSSGGAVSSYPHSRDGEIECDDDIMGYEDDHDGQEEEGEEEEEEEEEYEKRTAEDDDVEEVRNSLGIMKVQGGKTFYRGETHWAAVLWEIAEVKKYFEETKQKYESELEDMRCHSTAGITQPTGFPFTACPIPTKQDIMKVLPKKEVVDFLVKLYFENYEPIFHILHRPSFFKEYEVFWGDPAAVDPLWLGLLMAVLSVATKTHSISEDSPPELRGNKDMFSVYRAASEQCLIVGEYLKRPYLHTVQILIIMCLSTVEDNCWLLMGMLVRVAMAMGLHRDPKQFPEITPGGGELRRRIWTLITCMDLLTSIQVGLPSMVKEDECDTGLPLNLHDDEIGEDVTVLPPERGKDELTGVCYLISKALMTHALWEVVRQVNSVKARPPYEKILKLEAEIDEEYEKIPSFLRLKTIAESVNDPPWLIIQRHNLDILRQVAFLTLHRPYAARARLNPRYIHSNRRCVNAAVTLLKHQDDIFSQGETTLRTARWYTESQGTHEYLHAAVVVCLDLSCPTGPAPYTAERKDRYTMLYRSRDISEKLGANNIEARKAHGVLSLVLDKLSREETTLISSFEQRLAAGANRLPEYFPTPAAVVASPPKSDQATALTLGMMSSTSNPGFVSPLTQAAAPATVASPPGWSALWGNGLLPTGFEMLQASESDEWDEFMRGIDLDTSQLGGFPVMPGIGVFPNNTLQGPEKRYGGEDGGGAG